MTGRPAIASKIPSKSDCWWRQELLERAPALLLAGGHDHLAHDRQPVLGHEHVLGPAEADPLRSELARLRRVLGRVCVRPHLQAAKPVGPAEDRLEVLVDLRRDEVDRAEDHAAGAAVDRDRVALAEVVAVERRLLRLLVDRERLAAGDARLAHPAGDDCCVGGHPSVRGEDALGRDHPVDVVGGRLPADEDHVLAGAAFDRGVGVEDQRTRWLRRARR